MTTSTYSFLVGVDWGSAEHQVAVLDSERHLVAERRVPHTAPACTNSRSG